MKTVFAFCGFAPYIAWNGLLLRREGATTKQPLKAA